MHLALLPLAILFMSEQNTTAALLQRAREIHRKAIVIDLHADTTQRLLDERVEWSKRLPDGHLDIPRMKEGGLGAEFFSIWVEPKFAPHFLARAMAQIDAVHAAVEKNAKDIAIATTAADIDRKSTRLNSSHIQKSRMPSSA